MEKTVLVVEDEPKLAALLEDYLHQSGYLARSILRGDGVVEWVRENKPDLMLLDLMLPGKNGIDICREVRAFSPVPIIMLTARVEEIDRLMGLELGADDYLCKPYSPREVMARIKAIFRRIEFSAVREVGDCRVYRDIEIDEARFVCRVSGHEIDLTPVEMRLLLKMTTHPGRVFNRDQLMAVGYTDNRVVSDRTIDTHIKNIRAKLNEMAGKGELIHSIYGVGYKLE